MFFYIVPKHDTTNDHAKINQKDGMQKCDIVMGFPQLS